MIFTLWSIWNESQAVWLCQEVGVEEKQVEHMGEMIRERARERQTKMRKHVLCVCLVESLLRGISLPWSCRNILVLCMAQSPPASGSCKGKGEYLLPKQQQQHRGEVGISSLPAVGIPCCAQPPYLRTSRGFLPLAGRICNV